MIFDGVLYDREKLRGLLNGSSVPATTDADLALQAYRRWGEEMLHKLRGVFALVIWDGERDTLLCARDPLGLHPLFYADAGRELLLSTSIEALVRHPRVSGAVNRAALADHLCHRWPTAEETYFTSVRRLLPGHVMRVNTAGRRTQRYWEPAPLDAPLSWASEADTERFDELFEQAVSRCLEGGPVGICLSGGLDSVSVGTFAADISRRRDLPAPVALSIGFPDDEGQPEEVVQRGVATSLGLEHVWMPLYDAIGSDAIIGAALALSEELPAPLLGIYSPAYQPLMREGKRRGCEAILTGGGGDEWLTITPQYAADLMATGNLWGLYRLWRTQRRSYRNTQLLMLKGLLWTCGARLLMSSVKERLLEGLSPEGLRSHRRWQLSRSVPRWLAPDERLRKELLERAERRLQPMPRPGEFYEREGRRCFEHATVSLELEELFEKGRRAGVRILMPYWDVDLIHLLYRTPPPLLNHGGRTKGLVRRSLERRFPHLGFERQKKVIGAGEFWRVLFTEGADIWRARGGTPALSRLGVIDPRALDSTVAGILANPNALDGYVLWDALNVDSWVGRRL